MRFWRAGLLLAAALAIGACQQPEGPALVSQQFLLDCLKVETEKPPVEQDQERIRELLANLRQQVQEQERVRRSQSQAIEALLSRLEKESRSSGPLLAAGPLVVEVQFSFDTRPRDLDGDGTPDALYVTVWPKDHAGDTVKAVGTMQFVLSRRPPFDFGVRGEVLQSWPKGPQSVDEAWQDAWVFRGHHFTLPLDEEARQARRVLLEVGYIAPDGRELTAEKRLKL